MKIINFYNDLQEREKKLLFISFVLIILLEYLIPKVPIEATGTLFKLSI